MPGTFPVHRRVGLWKTPGFEINLPISGQFAVCVTASSAGTGTTFFAEVEYTE